MNAPRGAPLDVIVAFYTEPPNERGCRLWTGALNRGYGKVWFKGKSRTVTRLLLADKLGRPLKPGMQACHACDTPKCCTVTHLFEGTAGDNQRDKTRKGRAARGLTHGMTKLTPRKVRAIRLAHSKGRRAIDIARRYGVRKGTIYFIVKRQTWQHV